MKSVVAILGVLFLAGQAVAEPVQVVPQNQSGWWVVTASLDSARTDLRAAILDVVASVELCGHHPFVEYSDAFVGFAPGYGVAVLGAFDTHEEAQAVLETVLPCVPDAYLKQAHLASDP